MTAKEMFEELGYDEVKNTSSNILVYNNLDIWITQKEAAQITFVKDSKIYEVQGLIDIKLHRAICKQMEELGWL